MVVFQDINEPIVEKHPKQNIMVIFGRGAALKNLCTDFPAYPVYFCDSLPERQGTYCDTEVLSVEEVVQRYAGESF